MLIRLVEFRDPLTSKETVHVEQAFNVTMHLIASVIGRSGAINRNDLKIDSIGATKEAAPIERAVHFRMVVRYVHIHVFRFAVIATSS